MLHRCVVPSIQGPPGFGRLPGVSWPGLKVSPGRLLQDRIVDREIRDDFAKSDILEFNLFQAFGLIHAKAAKFLAPAVVGNVGNLQLATHFGEGHTLGKQDFRFPKLSYDLFRGILPSTQFSLL